MRLLFVTATRVGDAVLSTAALAHLLDRYPDARVTIACGPAAAGVFDGVPGLEHIIILKKRRFSLHWLALWAECVGRLWDVVVDLRGAPLTYLIPCRKRYGMEDAGDIDSHRVVRLGRVMGIDGPPPPPRLWTRPEHDQQAAELVPAGKPVLAVGPTANWQLKQWPEGHFTALVERLTGPDGILPGARVMLIGRSEERASVQHLVDSVPEARRIDLLDGLPLLTVYACIKRAAFYVGNDSGLMHMAAAAGVPTLGLFGPSREEQYAPWGPLCATVRGAVAYDDVFPDDYDYRTASTNMMADLDVDTVERAARDLWARTREPVA